MTSPPEVPGRRPGFGVGDGRGLEPGFAGKVEGGGGGVVGEGVRGCAEWAVSFSGYLEQGITTVKVGEGGSVAGGAGDGCERIVRGEKISAGFTISRGLAPRPDLLLSAPANSAFADRVVRT